MRYDQESEAKHEMMNDVKREIDRHRGSHESYDKIPDWEDIRYDGSYGNNWLQEAHSRNVMVEDMLSEFWEDESLHERYYHTLEDWDSRYVKDTPSVIRDGIIAVCLTHIEKCDECLGYAMQYEWAPLTKKLINRFNKNYKLVDSFGWAKEVVPIEEWRERRKKEIADKRKEKERKRKQKENRKKAQVEQKKYEKDDKVRIKTAKESKVKLGKFTVQGYALDEYANCVRFSRQQMILMQANPSMAIHTAGMFGMNALDTRIKWHKEVFKSAGIPYHGDIEHDHPRFTEAVELNEEIEKYVTRKYPEISKEVMFDKGDED